MNYKLIILIIFILFVFLKNKNKNNKIDKWEHLQNDNYFNNFNAFDLKFRGCSSKENCKQKYIDNVYSFTSEEEQYIVKIIENLNNLIDFRYRKIFGEINFIKVDNKIESSMPHTRGNNIILSKNWISNMIQKFKKNPKDLVFPKLLAHEQFHIFQRNNKSLMDELYSKYWNLVKYDKPLPIEILEINRTNPDALPNINWLFRIDKTTLILPLCVYSKDSNSLRDTQNIYIRLDNNLKFIDLKTDLDERKLLINLDSFRKYFGEESANNYHPNELSSSLFEIVIEEEVSGNFKNSTNGFNKLKKFLHKYINI
jgi:hypothetical protein